MAALTAYYSIDQQLLQAIQKAAGKPGAAAAGKTRPPPPALKPTNATTTQSPPPPTAAAVDDDNDATRMRRGFPPTFVYHAKDDATVPFENSVRLADALKAAGVR